MASQPKQTTKTPQVPQKQEKEKSSNLNFWLAVVFFVAIYFGNNKIQEIENSLNKNTQTLIDLKAGAELLLNKQQIAEADRVALYKVRRNQEVWKGTACAQCHTSAKTALPIYNRSIPELIEIIRNGTDASKAGGMPLYSNKADRKKFSITDSEIQVRLELLMSEDILKHTPKPPKANTTEEENNNKLLDVSLY